jgi:hypothetical protein
VQQAQRDHSQRHGKEVVSPEERDAMASSLDEFVVQAEALNMAPSEEME